MSVQSAYLLIKNWTEVIGLWNKLGNKQEKLESLPEIPTEKPTHLPKLFSKTVNCQ